MQLKSISEQAPNLETKKSEIEFIQLVMVKYENCLGAQIHFQKKGKKKVFFFLEL